MTNEPITFNNVLKYVNTISDSSDIIANRTKLNLGTPDKLPIRFDAIVLILCISGEATIGIDMIEHCVKPNSFVILNQNNYVTSSVCTDDAEVIFFVISHEAAEIIRPSISDVLGVIHFDSVTHVVNLSDDMARSIQLTYEILHQRLQLPQSKLLKKANYSLMQSLMYSVFAIAEQNHKDNVKQNPASRKNEIFDEFMHLLTRNFRVQRQVSWYADQLHITPKHLSTVIKECTSRNASAWIETFVIMEAKILLRNTTNTIQQISNLLNFPNQSFFGKYFKHITGISPSQYRRQ